MTDQPETLEALLRRFCENFDEPRDVPRVSLTDAILRGDDPLHLLPYLAGLGMPVASLDDLLAINADDTEEEISAFRVAEGVAVTVASDGIWALFTP
jgi:hypothetical protein